MSNRNPRLLRSRLSLALLAAMAIPTGAAFAQDTAATNTATEAAKAADEAKKKSLDKVTVTGSRIGSSATEGPAPLVIISRADIDREGYQTVGDILQALSQNTTASFTGDVNVNSFTPNAQVVNLRNLGPGYTLTLINGRRPAQYPQPYNRDNNVVNVKAIPSSIIERIEILTGGASAIYGSDAVAGVVNIITKKDFDGQYLRGTIGTTEEGGGDNYKLEYSGGATSDRWSAVWALQIGDTEGVFASQREILSSNLAGPRGFIPNVTNPGLALAVLRQSNAIPGSPLGFNVAYDAAACDAFGYTTTTTATRGKYCGAFDQAASRSIFNDSKFRSIYGYGTFDLSDNLQVFGGVTYYSSDSASSSGVEFWGTSGDQFMRSRGGAARSTYFDPQYNANIQLQRIFNPSELGGPAAATTLYDEQTYDVHVGMSGVIADRFDWEATLATSRYDYTADRPRLLAQAVHDYFLGPLLGYTSTAATGVPIYRLNLARWNTPITPEIYRSFSTRVINEAQTESSSFNFVVTGDLWELPAGAVGFAATAEAASQKFDLISDPRTNQLRPLDAGTIYNLTSSGESHGERNRYAVGLEFKVPITASFLATAAVRYDKYDDITAVDDAITKSFGLEWRPFSNLLLRSSYATSFRAPDMQLVFAEGAASFSTVVDEYACRSGVGIGLSTPPVPRSYAACAVTGDRTVYSAQTLIAGNPNLKEEEGESLSGGFVWDITKDMTMSVDYWRIKLVDAAAPLSSGFILRAEAGCRLGVDRDGTPYPNDINSAFCQNILGLITRLPAEPGTTNDLRIQRVNSAYINTALADTSGIDATFKYNWQMGGLGRFGLDLSYSLMLTNKYKQFDSDPLIDYRDNVGVSDQRSRIKGSLYWATQNWRTTIAATRYGSAGSWQGVDFVDGIAGVTGSGKYQGRRLSPYMLYSLTIGRKFGDNLDVQLAINNALNNQFREDNGNFSYPFFDPSIGSDLLGRRYYLSAGYKF